MDRNDIVLTGEICYSYDEDEYNWHIIKSWHNLKLKLKNDIEYHDRGLWESSSASIYKKHKCEEILNYMNNIEVDYKSTIKELENDIRR